MGDLTLFELATPVQLNKRVNIACLPEKGVYPSLGKECMLAGKYYIFLIMQSLENPSIFCWKVLDFVVPTLVPSAFISIHWVRVCDEFVPCDDFVFRGGPGCSGEKYKQKQKIGSVNFFDRLCWLINAQQMQLGVFRYGVVRL